MKKITFFLFLTTLIFGCSGDDSKPEGQTETEERYEGRLSDNVWVAVSSKSANQPTIITDCTNPSDGYHWMLDLTGSTGKIKNSCTLETIISMRSYSYDGRTFSIFYGSGSPLATRYKVRAAGEGKMSFEIIELYGEPVPAVESFKVIFEKL